MSLALRLSILALILTGIWAAWAFERHSLRDGSSVDAASYLAGCAVDRWVRLEDGTLVDAATGLQALRFAAHLEDGRLVLDRETEQVPGPEPDLECAT